MLASSSPRRKEILRSLCVPFVVIHPDIDESVCDRLIPEHRVVALAEKKALEGAALMQANPDAAWGDTKREEEVAESGQGPRLLLAADTLVAFHRSGRWKTIGKPEDRDDARAMLTYMAGKTHTVFSGLCLLDTETGARHTVCSSTSVRFAPMSALEIESYLDTDEWRGAAGAYRVQGRGSCFIEMLKGSWSCVVGLPIRELYGILINADYDFGATGRL